MEEQPQQPTLQPEKPRIKVKKLKYLYCSKCDAYKRSILTTRHPFLFNLPIIENFVYLYKTSIRPNLTCSNCGTRGEFVFLDTDIIIKTGIEKVVHLPNGEKRDLI